MPQPASSQSEDAAAVGRFREYLRIASVHPDVDYEPCVRFLQRQAAGLGLPVRLFSPAPGKPVVLLTWAGAQPHLPALLLNSHMDVVPVFEESWSHKPFDADMDENGNIFARGAQDMKCVGMQYLEAIRRLKAQGVVLQRTFHVAFVPDEETGGKDGMEKFVLTDDFRSLNVGFSLDEGMANPGEEFVFFNGERTIWHIRFDCPGQPGHGSLLLPNNAGVKLRYIIDKLMDLRAAEKKRLDDNPQLTIGDVTTVNLTQLSGGVQPNVVPEMLSAMFDVRLHLGVDLAEFEAQLERWCREAGAGVAMAFDQKDPKVPATPLDDSNPYWVAFKRATDRLGLVLKRQTFPGGTDSRFLRALGIPAIGFSPMNGTPVLLHDHDEFLHVDVFLRGITIYCELLQELGNLPATTTTG